jgi:enoyl-[acyl-carrier protein] reductase I
MDFLRPPGAGPQAKFSRAAMKDLRRRDACPRPALRPNPPLPRGGNSRTTHPLFTATKRMSLLAGKLGIVFGVANKRSIAWAIAQAWHKAGAKLAFTYQGERLKENVEELVGTFGADTLLMPCDVTKDEDIATVFKTVGEKFGKLDLLLHSVAFAPKEALEGQFINTTREAYRVAHDISAYSLVALARGAEPLMTEGGSIVAMSYYGAEKVVPHYNVMGVAKASLEASTRYLAYDLGPKKIRVNCISAGPVQTLAARGISGFSSMMKHYEEHAPLKRSCTTDELGATGVFLASEGAASITGQVLYVDGGYQIMGM